MDNTKAITLGQTDPKKLASLRHYNCKKSEEEIAKALHSNGRKVDLQQNMVEKS